MAPNAYDVCPCGSGKKFKWCCVGFYDKLELALDQQQQGQHDAAIRSMEALTKANPDSPQLWAYYSHILFAEGKTEEAEKAVQQAFALQPDFPMGYFLRGLYRQAEGELIGSLILFRKAAEAYPPDAREHLAQVHEMIARGELMLNRPVASRAALEQAVQARTGTPGFDPEVVAHFEALFGNDSRLPEVARKAYRLRPTAKTITLPTEVRKLSVAKNAYEKLVEQVPTDPAAWFNLGLVKAWLGEQPAAVDALKKSLELEPDDFRAEEAAALIEMLNCGQGMEQDADYLEYRVALPIRDVKVVSEMLQRWGREGRLMSPEMDEQTRTFSALVVEEVPAILDTGTAMGKVMANLQISDGIIRLWFILKDRVEKIGDDIRTQLNLAVGEPVMSTGPVQFGDLTLEAMNYPLRTNDVAEAERKLCEMAANFYETVWIHRPFRSLGGASPIDAVGSKLLRKRLLGMVKFLESALDGAAPRKAGANGEPEVMKIYDFEKLRHKLGLERLAADPPKIDVPPEPIAPPAPAPTPAAPVAIPAKKREFAAMNVAELASFAKAELSVAELEDALRAAIKLDARELAVQFAKVGSTKPADAAKPDRYPFYACLMTAALAEGNTAESLQHAHDGATYDAAHNDGKRANDYATRRAALFLKSGDANAAAAEFETILARHPDEGNFYVKAAEAMLSAKNGAKAADFAKRGLEKGIAMKNRDLQGVCQELLEAAKRYS